MTTRSDQTNFDLTNKTSRIRHSSIRTKITLWAGLGLALVSFILIGYSVITLRQAAIENATDEALAISEKQAALVSDVLDRPYMTARILADSLGVVKDPSIPTNLSRDEINAMLRKVLVENPSFLGVYTLWEPNEFDGLDSQYIRAVAHDETGRFIPYWVRDPNGIIHTEALTQYEIPGVGDWYILPRSTMQEITIAPIVRRIQEQDLTIASFIVPIVWNGRFFGIVGVDAPIGVMQELVDNINLYDGAADVALFTQEGTLIAVRNRPDIANQSVELIYKDYSQIRSQLNVTFSRISQDGKSLQIFSPIEADEGGTLWVLGLSIPLEKITSPATYTAIRQAAIGLTLILFALIFLWLVAGQIVRPMQELTRAAQAVSLGDLNARADVRGSDETAILADAFNSMTLQLGNLFATLEQRVADRTRALTTVAEIGTATSTILELEKLLHEIVELSKERFNLYHSHIYLLDEAGENLVLTAGAGEAGRIMAAEGHSIPLAREQSLVARAAREGKGVIVNDITQSPDFLPNPLLPNTRSELAVPMMVGNRVIGVFDVQSDMVERFTDADIAIQTTLASQAAAAIENARLYTQAEITRQETQLLVDYAGEAIMILDLTTGLFKEPNANAEKIYGLPREELVKVGPAQMSPPRQPDGRDSAEKAMEMIGIAMEKGIHIFEWDHINGQGDLVPCEVRLVRLPGEHPRLRVSVLDITERKRLEELTVQRARQQEALNQITQKIQSATTVESALQIAARELGHALGRKPTMVALDPATLTGKE